MGKIPELIHKKIFVQQSKTTANIKNIKGLYWIAIFLFIFASY